MGPRAADQALEWDDAGGARVDVAGGDSEGPRRVPDTRSVHGPRSLAKPGLREEARRAEAPLDRAVLEGARKGRRAPAPGRGHGARGGTARKPDESARQAVQRELAEPSACDCTSFCVCGGCRIY